MESQPVTEWFPLPEVDEDNEGWERTHTTSKGKLTAGSGKSLRSLEGGLILYM